MDDVRTELVADLDPELQDLDVPYYVREYDRVDADPNNSLIQQPVPVPGGDTVRRYDIVQHPATVETGQPQLVIEHKSNNPKTYATEDVIRQIEADRQIQANGQHEVLWIFDGEISEPLQDALNDVGAASPIQINFVTNYGTTP